MVVALEPHSSALRVYDRGEGTALTIRPADLEALHLGALSGNGGTAMYLHGTVVGSAAVRFRRQSGGDALRLVMAENMGPWLRAFAASRWKVEGNRDKFADAWRRRVEELFAVGGMLHLPQPPVRPAAPPAAVARPVPKAALGESVASPWVPCVPRGGCPGGVSGGGAWRSLDCPSSGRVRCGGSLRRRGHRAGQGHGP